MGIGDAGLVTSIGAEASLTETAARVGTGVRNSADSMLRRRSKPGESTSCPVSGSRILRHSGKAAAAACLLPALNCRRTVELGKPTPGSGPMLKQRDTMAANSLSLA